MYTTPRQANRLGTNLWTLLGLTAALLVSAGLTPAGAQEKKTKVDRQIGVMEKVIDGMLVDSPNFLVAGKEVTEGFELEDYGAVFTFEASLTGPYGFMSGSRSAFNFWPFRGNKKHVVVLRDGDDKKMEIKIDGKKMIVKNGGVWVDGDGEEHKLSDDEDLKVFDEKSYREDQLKKYEAAKEELIKVLMDYGETLRALPAGQSVRIIARLDDLDLPEGKDVRKLTVRAKIDDLRAYGEERLSESAMRAKIEMKES